jgi:hypothetical protein
MRAALGENFRETRRVRRVAGARGCDPERGNGDRPAPGRSV